MKPTTMTQTTFRQVSPYGVIRRVTVLSLGSHWAYCAFETEHDRGALVLGIVLRSTIPTVIAARVVSAGNATTGT